MAAAGILFFREPPSWQRIAGIAFCSHRFVFAAQIKSELNMISAGLPGI
jgi:drug/metabolite transporter (DMT)-like permease